MSESFEKARESGNSARAAILIVLMNLVPAASEAALPDCHDVGSKPEPTRSFRFEDN